ncbi:glycosyl hydrolase [Parapedobacter sp. DT-150]|uniref:glycosyl hydrolase n=1 Tax=Parapedobacter sp. DT-150 TaxID=3396162 RepID=UPI003F1CDF63
MINARRNATWLLVMLWTLGCDGGSTQLQESGKIQWPELTEETKPWTRWWWFGSAVTERDITAMLEAFQKAGLGGVEITPIYGTRGSEGQFIDFLTPQWMDKLVYTLNEAKRLGLGVDMANASGWPFGGPWVAESDATKNFVSSVVDVRGGERFQGEITYTQQPLVRTQGSKKVTIDDIKQPVTANSDLQAYAFDQVRYEKELPLVLLTANRKGKAGFEEVIDLTSHVNSGMLDWTAPSGDWVLCALFEGDHGKMVERAGPGGEGKVIDHFSEPALRRYLGRFDDAFKGYDLSYLRYYFNDSYEVDDAAGEANWTPAFLQEFKQFHGYDLKDHLPALLGRDTPEMNSRVIYDYRVAIGRLLLERFTENWQTWAAQKGKGIRNQAHGSPANVLDLYAASDVPEIEGSEIVNLKSAPSAAHVTGKRLVSSESGTWLGEHFQSTLGDVKSALDTFFLAGVNHVFYHGTAYSPQDAPWPGWLFYAAVHFTPANSFWDDFGTLNQYVARTQRFLQAGKPANDVLLYFGIADLWSDTETEKQLLRSFHSNHLFDGLTMKMCGDFLTEGGYAWDALSDHQLLAVSCTDAALHTGGNRYKTVLVPETHYMPAKTFEQLVNLAQAGATIVFHKTLPEDVPGLADLENSRGRLRSLKNQLSFEQKGNLRIAAHGKGQLVISDELEGLMTYAGVTPENMYSQGLQCIRRLKDDGNFYYFITNSREVGFEGWVTLQADYASAARYNPMTGIAGYARTRESDGNTEIYLQMKPDESLVVETFKGRYTGDDYPYYRDGNADDIISLDRDWTLAFTKGGPALPKTVAVDQLGSWTEYGPEYASFSGTAEYTTRIPNLPGGADAWLLDLGTVNESAAIYLNGEYLGTLIGHPYTLDIPAKHFKGSDTLTIKISNLMANRIADMDKKGIPWRIFYNTNVNARLRSNMGDDGKFTAKGWQPMDSGLLGPVLLKPLLRLTRDDR